MIFVLKKETCRRLYKICLYFENEKPTFNDEIRDLENYVSLMRGYLSTLGDSIVLENNIYVVIESEDKDKELKKYKKSSNLIPVLEALACNHLEFFLLPNLKTLNELFIDIPHFYVEEYFESLKKE